MEIRIHAFGLGDFPYNGLSLDPRLTISTYDKVGVKEIVKLLEIKLGRYEVQQVTLYLLLFSLEHWTVPVQLQSHHGRRVKDIFDREIASQARKSDGW